MDCIPPSFARCPNREKADNLQEQVKEGKISTIDIPNLYQHLDPNS